MAILAKNASFKEFAEYVETHKGPKTDTELEELWEWRQKLLGLRVITGTGYRCLLYTSPSPRDRGCSRMPSSA